MMARRVGLITGICLALAAVALAPRGAVAGARAPGDFLTLDLPDAVMSPDPLGPLTQFQPPVPAAASVPVGAATRATDASADAKPAAGTAPPARHVAALLHRRVAAHHHGNPLDAEASVPHRRIQRWPCRSGGICAWQTSPSR